MRSLLAALLMLAACSGSDDSSLAALPAPAAAALTVSWTRPTLNVDGTALTDIASYRVAYGTAPAALSLTATAPATQTALTLGNLTPGATYYVTVSAVNSAWEASSPAGPASGLAR